LIFAMVHIMCLIFSLKIYHCPGSPHPAHISSSQSPPSLLSPITVELRRRCVLGLSGQSVKCVRRATTIARYTCCRAVSSSRLYSAHLAVIFAIAQLSCYPRDGMLARVIAIATCLSVCLSVCPSRAGIVSKRRKTDRQTDDMRSQYRALH